MSACVSLSIESFADWIKVEHKISEMKEGNITFVHDNSNGIDSEILNDTNETASEPDEMSDGEEVVRCKIGGGHIDYSPFYCLNLSYNIYTIHNSFAQLHHLLV